MYRKIREWITESLNSDFDSIVPGVTRYGDLEHGRSLVDKNGNAGRGDHVIQGGDLICLEGGSQSGAYMDPEWEFGNFYEVEFTYAYVLKEGETELPPRIKKAWEDVMKVRKILDENIKAGRSGGETFEILKRKIEEAGYIYVNRQIYETDQDPEKTQVPLDLHAAEGGIYAPRIGPLGPDWQREMILSPNHHFFQEYWVYLPMPQWGEGKYLSIQLHDGAIATEEGVEYFYPPPREIRLIR